MLLGDVVVCPSVAARQAPTHAGSYDDELALLVVHGLLHILGMDHDDPEEAEAMESRERELLSKHHRRQGSQDDQAGDHGASPAAEETTS